MRYLMIHKLDESLPEAWNPSPEFIDKMGAFMGEVQASGALLAAEGVHQSKEGALIRKDTTGLTVTDGPFTEAREVIGGFALVEVADKAEAIQLGQRFADLFPQVSVEVRRVFEEEDFGAVADSQDA
ncbi:YciI family protein [Intrasporangium calvum]|uniref:YCII-related protein n=1 Tax=Intrasporangium calvum (strain ATCC 23552 / DSM 43043 / JCM 3097 / NBRC 12989 / NCIMB 10167 / NRRL B-3866 / 7 KIP) TaxID=710696 RepID=E6SFB9_INTC7|nr:YciI family protein [Intrasporangium calvum]ADU46657.1 YCII-related protein [Intrasporangium calvum DSM 43043]